MERALVDEIGGLDKALALAAELASRSAPPQLAKIALLNEKRVQTLREPRSGLSLPFGGGASAAVAAAAGGGREGPGSVLALCDESVACTGLVDAQLLGVGPAVAAMGLTPALAYTVAHSPVGVAIEAAAALAAAATQAGPGLGLSGAVAGIAGAIRAVVEEELL